MTFGVTLLADDPHRLSWLRKRWRWILVDEFQDTSHAQARLVDLLAGPSGNLCVVGNDDQLIHAWRHADPTHILGFGERHPGHAEILLGRNFRSRAEILHSPVSCVSHNQDRAPKALIAVRGGEVARSRRHTCDAASAVVPLRRGGAVRATGVGVLCLASVDSADAADCGIDVLFGQLATLQVAEVIGRSDALSRAPAC